MGAMGLRHSKWSKRRSEGTRRRLEPNVSAWSEQVEVVVVEVQAARRSSITGRCFLPRISLSSAVSAAPPAYQRLPASGYRPYVNPNAALKRGAWPESDRGDPIGHYLADSDDSEDQEDTKQYPQRRSRQRRKNT